MRETAMRCLSAVLLGALIAFAAAPAEAASTTNAVEKGVNVWRGPPTKAAPAGPSLKGAGPPCIEKTLIIVRAGYPERRLGTHGFWSGDGLDSGLIALTQATTQGFYADRIAAGL
jgi:hypothetical protein